MLVRNPLVRDARVERVSSSLARAGHHVTVVAVAEPELARHETRNGVEIVRIDVLPRFLSRGRSPIASPSAPAPRASSRPFVRAALSPLFVLRDVMIERSFFRAAAAIAADVYHANDVNTLAAAARAAAQNRAHLVYDAHELYWAIAGLSEPERRRWRRVESRWIGRAARVFTVSDSLADELQRAHGIARPDVVLNCPEPSGSEATASPLRDLKRDTEMLVLYLGGFSSGRGLEQLAAAARGAKGWRLALMGWGALEDELRRAGDHLLFLPSVEPDKVVAVARGADLGVIPYVPVGRNNELSLPNKLFELIQAGVPVAASDLPELRRFVEETGAGVVFRPGDAADMRATLDAIAADRERLARMRESAERAARIYTWASQEEKLLRAYESLGR